MQMKVGAKNRTAPFDREVHGEAGAYLAELVDEILRLNGRIQGARRPTGLSGSGQAIVLASVVLAAEPPTVARIARSLGYSRQAVQRVADVLANEGHVLYVDNPNHKTSRQLVATDLGRRVYEQANNESAEWTKRISLGLDPASLARTLEDLRQIRRNLEQDKNESALASEEQK
jgi:DNA-binding MarR family transcriptional regulator